MNPKLTKKKIDKKYIHLFYIVFLIIFSYFILKKYFMLGLLTLIGAISSFFHDKKNKTVYDFRINIVIGILIASHYNIMLASIFYIIAQIIPNFLAGGRVDGLSLVFHGIALIVFFVATLFSNINIITIGIIIVIIEGIIGVFINMSLGLPPFVSISASSVAVIMRIIYFLTLGRLIEFLFKII